jgi:hypothetical protein
VLEGQEVALEALAVLVAVAANLLEVMEPVQLTTKDIMAEPETAVEEVLVARGKTDTAPITPLLVLDTLLLVMARVGRAVHQIFLVKLFTTLVVDLAITTPQPMEAARR